MSAIAAAIGMGLAAAGYFGVRQIEDRLFWGWVTVALGALLVAFSFYALLAGHVSTHDDEENP
jgi:phosphate/sulfate permease